MRIRVDTITRVTDRGSLVLWTKHSQNRDAEEIASVTHEGVVVTEDVWIVDAVLQYEIELR